MKFKMINLVLGSTYASGNSLFESPINFPSTELNDVESEDANIKLSRLGFLVGIEIPIFDINIK